MDKRNIVRPEIDLLSLCVPMRLIGNVYNLTFLVFFSLVLDMIVH